VTKQADLTAYVFEGVLPNAAIAQLSRELPQWMDASSRFTVFVDTYRDKIRKKIRVTRDPESALDVRSELEVAYRLLNDRRLVITYEPYASAKRRGPDFSVTYRANLVFNIEVARLRVEENAANQSPAADQSPAANQAAEEQGNLQKEERILRILLYKLGQMQPGMGNLLAIHTGAGLVRSIDLGRLAQGVKIQVERKDPAFYAATRYSGPADFYKDFQRLSGILMWASEAPAEQLWINKQARPALAENVLRVVALALRG
jgi:hypothetical protein